MSLVSSSSSMKGAVQVGACLLLVAGLAFETIRRRRRGRKGEQHGAGLTAQARLIGGTPMLRLDSLSELCGCEFLAKAEHLNPSGTGKDRIALEMILRAERRGDLPSGGGGVVVEGSSGSTVLSLAPLAVAFGHSLVAVVPDDVSIEKVSQLRATPQVRVVITRASAISSPSHYVNVARRIARELQAEGKKAVFMDQFETPANFDAHYNGTGLEILKQTKRVDAFVMSAGTGGTIAGVSRRLKERDPSTRVYLADPPGSALFSRVKHGVCYATEQQERSLRRHRYDTIADGVGLDRVTANFKLALVDDAIRVTDAEAVLMAHFLLRFEGLLLGPSAALNCLAAARVAMRLRHESSDEQPVVVLTVLCDAGARYLSRFWSRDFLKSRGLEWPEEDAAGIRSALLAALQQPPTEGDSSQDAQSS